MDGVDISLADGYLLGEELVFKVVPVNPQATVTVSFGGSWVQTDSQNEVRHTPGGGPFYLAVNIFNPDDGDPSTEDMESYSWGPIPQYRTLSGLEFSIGNSSVVRYATQTSATPVQLTVPAGTDQVSVSVRALNNPALNRFNYAITSSQAMVQGNDVSDLVPGHNYLDIQASGEDSREFSFVLDVFVGTPLNDAGSTVRVNGLAAEMFVRYNDFPFGDENLSMNISATRLEAGATRANIHVTPRDPNASVSFVQNQQVRPGLNWINISMRTAMLRTEDFSVLAFLPTDPYGPSADASAEIGYRDAQDNWISISNGGVYNYDEATGNLANQFDRGIQCTPANSSATCTVEYESWSYDLEDENAQYTRTIEVGNALVTVRAANDSFSYMTFKLLPDNLSQFELSQLGQDGQPQNLITRINNQQVKPGQVVTVPAGTNAVRFTSMTAFAIGADVATSGGSNLVPGYNVLLAITEIDSPLEYYLVYVEGAPDPIAQANTPTPSPTPMQNGSTSYSNPTRSVEKPSAVNVKFVKDKLQVDYRVESTQNIVGTEVAVSFDGEHWFSRIDKKTTYSSKEQGLELSGFAGFSSFTVKIRTISENSSSDWTPETKVLNTASVVYSIDKKFSLRSGASWNTKARSNLVTELNELALSSKNIVTVTYSVKNLSKSKAIARRLQAREIAGLIQLTGAQVRLVGGVSVSTSRIGIFVRSAT